MSNITRARRETTTPEEANGVRSCTPITLIVATMFFMTPPAQAQKRGRRSPSLLRRTSVHRRQTSTPTARLVTGSVAGTSIPASKPSSSWRKRHEYTAHQCPPDLPWLV